MARHIEPGTEVISTHGSHVHAYGGAPENNLSVQMRFDLRYGNMTTLFCDPATVAPKEVAESINLKDPRIEVIKHAKSPGYWAAGPWEARIQGDEKSSWHKTKKDGVLRKATELAIRDWHAQEEVAVAI